MALLDPESLPIREWGISGRLLVPMAKAAPGEPVRRLAGWATTYARLGEDGTEYESWDRDDQLMEAAKSAATIDWSMYLKGGLWNDTHVAPLPNGRMPSVYAGRDPIYVGVPSGLEFCPPEHELAKTHRKAGWFTWGHLFDRHDPDSWRAYTSHRPSPNELDRADHFWETAQLLKDTGRTLGFSMHGLMATSPCGKRITWAKSNGLAVCELPSNADATAELMKAVSRPSIERAMGRAKVGAPPCGRCRCPPGVCGQLLRKAKPTLNASDKERRQAVIEKLMERFNLTETDAATVVDVFIAQMLEES